MGSNNSTVYTKGIPGYLFGSDGIIKCMKVNGEWPYDETMIKYLNLTNLIVKNQSQYGNNKGKLMTAAVMSYLKQTYPGK